ncbi:MAG TPA: GAF domain-containing protein [Terriglobales bacterium]|nr:GAF domain-containing protein [Terriglobales bacterium]
MPYGTTDTSRRLRRKTVAHSVSISLPRILTQTEPNLAALKLRLSGLLPAQSLSIIANEALAFTNAEGSAIALFDGNEVTCRARAGSLAPPLGTTVSRDSGISGTCMRTGEVICCNDTQNDPRVNAEACRQSGIYSMLAVPLSYDDDSFGVFAVFSGEADVFGERDIETLVLLSGLVPALKPESGPAIVELRPDPVLDLQETPPEGIAVPSPLPQAPPPQAEAKRSVPRTQLSARHIAIALETIRHDAAFQLLGRVKAYLTIESLYDGREREAAIDLCQELMFKRAEELGVTLPKN